MRNPFFTGECGDGLIDRRGAHSGQYTGIPLIVSYIPIFGRCLRP